MNQYASVKTEIIADQVTLITLNRPDKLNAISPEMLEGLQDALAKINLDSNTRVAIITGEGRGFCAGADLTSRDTAGAIPGTEGMGQLGFVYKYQEYLAKTMLAIHQCV